MASFAVELSPAAVRDIESLYDYVATTRSPREALELLGRFARRIDILEQFPNRGSIPPELAALGVIDFRQIPMLPYRLIYRVAERTVSILMISDGRRNMKELLEQRLLSE